jgi:hypothetical protein
MAPFMYIRECSIRKTVPPFSYQQESTHKGIRVLQRLSRINVALGNRMARSISENNELDYWTTTGGSIFGG